MVLLVIDYLESVHMEDTSRCRLPGFVI